MVRSSKGDKVLTILQRSGVARFFKLGGHFIRWKIVGGHAKKQATKKRYHFITLGVQQARSELLRTGGRAPLAARERARGTRACPLGKF